MTTPRISLRPPKVEDLGFIMKSWLKSQGRARSRLERNHGYWGAQKEVVSRLLEHARVIVACRSEPCPELCHAHPSDHIVGYGVGELVDREAVIHWIYVREDDRSKGIARQLLARLRVGAGVDMTITACTRPWIRAKAEQHYWRISEFAPLYSTIEQLRKAG